MQEGKSVIRFKSGAPPLEVYNILRKSTGNTECDDEFTNKRIITYKFGKRVLYLKISEVGRDGHVNIVDLKLCELIGKGSSAILNMRFIKNDMYGVLLCNIYSKFEGSYESFKDSYYGVPPMPDTKVIVYACRESGLGGRFTLEKKKDKEGVVERVKATHSFDIDGELSYNVSIKITDKQSSGLSVDVEGPMKHAVDYTNYKISTIKEKMEACILALINDSNATDTKLIKTNSDDSRKSFEEAICRIGPNPNQSFFS